MHNPKLRYKSKLKPFEPILEITNKTAYQHVKQTDRQTNRLLH
jgi:hypothetical protein